MDNFEGHLVALIKLSPTAWFRQVIRVQNLGFPDKKDHLNTKKNVRLDPAQNNRDKQARGEATNILRKPKL